MSGWDEGCFFVLRDVMVCECVYVGWFWFLGKWVGIGFIIKISFI